ncbi:MAG: peptidoglycan editing factor PgeF [Saprospiraceae bacterium]|nr:peptidoglycan editing factor PgeF [Saprospiraceae bacterium]
MFRTPTLFQRSELVAAESTRHGGVSPAPYDSLNLGKRTDDAPEYVEENRRRFGAAVGFRPEQLAWSYQVHGAEVQWVEAAGGSSGYDALVTRKPGVVLGVSVADCAPVLVYDMRKRAIAAIHAGWRGAVAGIVPKTLQAMAEWMGTRGGDCLAYVGTCIDECSFEVGPEVAAQFDSAFVRFNAAKGRHFVDLRGAIVQQLRACGLPAEQIEVSPYSTVLHSDDYFSHRLSGGRTGRMMAVIGLR